MYTHRRQAKALADGIAGRVRLLARECGTARELAKRCHIPEQTLNSIMIRNSYPRADILVALHMGVGVNVRWLVLGSGEIYGDQVRRGQWHAPRQATAHGAPPLPCSACE